MDMDLTEFLDGLHDAISEYNDTTEKEIKKDKAVFDELRKKAGALGLKYSAKFGDFVTGCGEYENISGDEFAIMEDVTQLLYFGDHGIIAKILEKCEIEGFENVCGDDDRRIIIELIHAAFNAGYSFRRMEERKED